MSVFGAEVNKLIKKIKNGDKNACEELFDTTYCHLKSIALLHNCSVDDVDDVLNEAYLKVFKYVKSAQLDNDCYNWMCKIVENTVKDFNQKKRVSFPINIDTENELVYEVEDELIDKSQICDMLNSLEEFDRQLVELKFLQDLTYKEVAKIVGKKKSTIYRRIQVLLKIIRKNLEKK